MQPAASAADGASGVKLVKGEAVTGEGPVNEEKWWRRRVEDVPVDEVFFHRYFTEKSKKEREMAEKVKKRKGKGGDEDDDEDEEGEESVDEGEEAEFSEEKDEDEDEAASEAEVGGAEEDEDEDESDKDEAEIWKVCRSVFCSGFALRFVCRL